MNILISGAPGAGSIFNPTIVVDVPYDTSVTSTQLLVGTGLVTIVDMTANPTKGYLVYLRNSSPASQNIRFGAAPSFGVSPAVGMLIEPGEAVVLYNITNILLKAIADAAGGTLERFITRKQ